MGIIVNLEHCRIYLSLCTNIHMHSTGHILYAGGAGSSNRACLITLKVEHKIIMTATFKEKPSLWE